MKQTFKTAYGKRERVSYETTGESLTQQHFKQEVDLKNIIRKYDRTGLIQNVRKGQAMYGDFTASVNEYADALNLIIAAQDNFAQLPSEIREAFGNDPGRYLEEAGNPEFNEKMYGLGLKQRPAPDLPEAEEAAEPPAPPEAGE